MSDGVQFVLVLVAEVMGVVGSGRVGVETLVEFFREADKFFDLFAEFAAEYFFYFFDGGLDVIPLDFSSTFFLIPGIKMVGHCFRHQGQDNHSQAEKVILKLIVRLKGPIL